MIMKFDGEMRFMAMAGTSLSGFAMDFEERLAPEIEAGESDAMAKERRSRVAWQNHRDWNAALGGEDIGEFPGLDQPDFILW